MGVFHFQQKCIRMGYAPKKMCSIFENNSLCFFSHKGIKTQQILIILLLELYFILKNKLNIYDSSLKTL